MGQGRKFSSFMHNIFSPVPLSLSLTLSLIHSSAVCREYTQICVQQSLIFHPFTWSSIFKGPGIFSVVPFRLLILSGGVFAVLLSTCTSSDSKWIIVLHSIFLVECKSLKPVNIWVKMNIFIPRFGSYQKGVKLPNNNHYHYFWPWNAANYY